MEADAGGPVVLDPFIVGGGGLRGGGMPLGEALGSFAFTPPAVGAGSVAANALGSANIGRRVAEAIDDDSIYARIYNEELARRNRARQGRGELPIGASDRAELDQLADWALRQTDVELQNMDTDAARAARNAAIQQAQSRSSIPIVIPLPVSPGVAAGITAAGILLGGVLGGGAGLPGSGSPAGSGTTGTSTTGTGTSGTGSNTGTTSTTTTETETTSTTNSNPKPEEEPPENTEWELHNGVWIPVPRTPPPGNVPPGQKWDKKDGNWVLVPTGTDGPNTTTTDDDWLNRGPGMVIWPGQPRTTECPIGQTRNPTTGQCEPVPVGKCPDGQTRNPTTGQCETIPVEQCPDGQQRNPVTGQCEVAVIGACPAGQTRNPTTGQCESPQTKCPPGQQRDANGNCVSPPPEECPIGQQRGPDGVCRTILVLPPNPTPNPTPVQTQPPSGGNISLTFPVATPITIRDPGLNREILREGRISTPAMREIAGSTISSYNMLGGEPGKADLEAFRNLLGQVGAYNPELTRIATEQTIAANRAQREANIDDVQRLGRAAMEAQREANPELYSTLGTYLPAATGMLATDLERLQGAGRLSAEDIRMAQQSAREASLARGREMDMSGMAAEVLNRDALVRQRQNEARANVQQSMQNVYGGIGAAQAATFNPFAALLGQQYGMQTSNVGLNQALFNQGTGFSSGALSNQFVQSLLNPYSSYAADVYGSNFNAANARAISEANANAAAQGANAQLIGGLAGATLNYAIPSFLDIFKPKG